MVVNLLSATKAAVHPAQARADQAQAYRTLKKHKAGRVRYMEMFDNPKH